MTPAELAILKAEIANDPLGRYSGMDDVAIAKSLAVRDRETDNESFSGAQLGACIDLAELTTLATTPATATAASYLLALIGCDTIPNTSTQFRTQLRNIFATGSNSKPRIVALLRRSGTRAEELGLRRVTESDVADAKRS